MIQTIKFARNFLSLQQKPMASPNGTKPILLYDGVCNLCSGVVKFVIKHDAKDRFYYASLQSATGKGLLEQYGLKANETDSFVFIDKGKVWIHSSAVLQLCRDMGVPWNQFYILMIIPRPIRDAVYKFIAINRYKWFGKKDSCMVPEIGRASCRERV